MENGTIAPSLEPSSLEERVGAQALAIDLKQAALACLAGAESHRWTVGELLARLKGLGVPGTRASVVRALAELELELELCPWAPWRLAERGQEWALVPKSELAGLLSGVRALPLEDPGRLSDEHKAVLLVVIGHRRKGGVSKTRVGELLYFPRHNGSPALCVEVPKLGDREPAGVGWDIGSDGRTVSVSGLPG